MFVELIWFAYRPICMLRDNRARARTARIFFLLYAVVGAGVALLSLAGVVAPARTIAGETLARALFLGSYGLLVLLQGLLTVGGYVVIILWLRRAYYNLHQLPGIHPEFSDGWAAGAWFVPFLGLVRPYTITREVWQDTQLAALGQVRQPATALGWWWASYLLKVLLSQLASQLTRDSGTFSPSVLGLSGCSAAAGCVFGFCTWGVISRMAGFEEQLAMRQQVDQLGQPAPPPNPGADQSDYALAEEY